MSVVFPHPLSPTIAVTLFAGIFIDIFLRTCSLLNCV